MTRYRLRVVHLEGVPSEKETIDVERDCASPIPSPASVRESRVKVSANDLIPVSRSMGAASESSAMI